MVDILLSYASTEKVPSHQYPHRVYNLLKEQKIDPDALKYIHITGSKGKGSIAKTCFELLKEKGEKVGCFISPHIFDVRERFETNKGLISESELASLVEQYKSIFLEHKLHFFEICLFLAICYFAKNCEFVVLEVGIGGRYDPTNFCTPLVSLLGHVSLEHTHFLGNTLEKIAYDKAGIIKPNIPAFSVPQDSSVQKIFDSEGSVRYIDSHSLQNQHIILNRKGKAHLLNFTLALTGINTIFPDLDEQIVQKVATQKVPFRIDQVSENIIIDTAHNGASFRNLLECLQNEFLWTEITFCITILKGKELEDIIYEIETYAHLFRNIIVFDFQEKSNGYEFYEQLSQKFSAIEYREKLDEIPIHKKLVFAGSFYSVPIITKLLEGNNA